MNRNNFMKKTTRFYISMILYVIEGLLAGCNFTVIYLIIKSLVEYSLNKKLLVYLSISLVLIFVLRLLIYSIGYTQGHIGGAEVAKKIRTFLGDKIKKIPLSGFTKAKVGKYINVVTTDVNNYENILTHRLGDIIKSISLVTILIIFMMTVYLPIGLVSLAAILTLIPALCLSFRTVKKYGNKKNKVLVENISDIVEYVTGIQTFRSYGLGGIKNKTVTNSMKKYSDISYWYERKTIPIGAGFSIICELSMPISLYIGGKAWFNKSLDTPSFFMMIILPIVVCKLWGVLFVAFTAYKNLAISKTEIINVLNSKEETNSDTNFNPKNYNICFENVNFYYEKNEPVLKGISFKAEDEKFTAIVGKSGSGKSTILNLISKYYEVHSGDIKIGEVSINNIYSEKVLNKISMVEQDTFLFNDSIKNNIKYARPEATDDEIIEACKLANCHEFIKSMKRGYDTNVGENGNRLSGGERQRISIARAILKNSPILLLDEATASLDIENELAVKNAIINLLCKKKTVIMIAHTLSVIKNADKILVVSNGQIAEEGTHEDLMKKQGKYYSMYSAEEKL